MFIYDNSFQLFLTFVYIFSILSGLILRFFLKNKSPIIKRIPIIVLSILFVVLEINKQLRNALGYDYAVLFGMMRGVKGEYTNYGLPFHFCSFFIFLLLLQVIFFKKEKARKVLENLSFLWSSLIVVCTFFNPSAIYSESVPALFQGAGFTHTILYHSLVIFYFFVSLSLETFHFELKKIWYAPVSIIVYAAIALPAAHLINENYCNILSIPNEFLTNIINKYGYFAYNGLMLITGCVGATLLYLVISLIQIFAKNIVHKNVFSYGIIGLIPTFILILGIGNAVGPEKIQSFYALLLLAGIILCLLPGIVMEIKDKQNNKVIEAENSLKNI